MSIITPQATLSYPAIFEPRVPMSGGDAVYSAVLVFPPGADLSALRAAAMQAGKDKFGDKFESLLKQNKLKLPFRDDGEDKGYEKGSIFITCKNKLAPGVVSKYAGPDNKPAVITDPKEIYAGAQVRASVKAFGYDTSGNKGVTFSLQNIQKLGDGKRLDGRKAPQDEFDAIEGEGSDLI